MKIERLPRTKRTGFSFGVRLFLCFSILVILSQAVSLYRRGSRGDTDISVFYRTTQLLNNGIGGEVYRQRDSKTGWPISIPPAGLSIFQPLSHLSPAAATMLWALFNLGLAAASVMTLQRYFAALDQKRNLHSKIFPCAAGMFLLLASGSLQVGQYSLMFTACWIFALYAAIGQRNYLSGFLWALPSAIKIYPALLLAAPLSLVKTIRGGVRVLLLFAAGFAVTSLLFPSLFYGLRTWELNTSFWQNTILSPESRMSEMQTLGTRANQSLDAVLLRYLSYDPNFHTKYSDVPHLNYTPETVLQFANIARLGILFITAIAVLSWRRNGFSRSPYNLLMMAALWSSTLYLILPETRTRYAGYTFLAFIPLLTIALAAKIKGDSSGYAARCAVIVVCFVLIMSFIPGSLRAFGLGFLGSLILWIENIRLIHFLKGRAVGKGHEWD
ncbi:MAG: DUF2029 domain-containing protein [Armatimonadetes bacterium]|nr:DUF2029 domain-containing protein [Armatimonadota bacterium]